MGYSCTARASFTLAAIAELIGGATSNEMPDGGFYEVGRERADGGISGAVWRGAGAGLVRPGGSFSIRPDGTVARFPGLSRADYLAKAEAMGAAKFRAIHGTWAERGAAMLTDLESGKIDPKLSWSWFESIFSDWQRERRIIFAVLPDATAPAMAEALRGMLGEAV